MAIDKVTYAAAKKYTDKTVAGGGAIKGKNCVVDSIMAITGGHRVTFKWTLDDGTVQTGYMDVMDGVDGVDGADGRGVASVDVDANNHLIITYDDGTDHDAGEINVAGQTIQRNVLPPASASELGNIYQYIGADTATLVNGYFYQCVVDGTGYKWEEKTVQRAGGSITIDTELDPTSHNAVENMAIAVPIQALQGSMGNVKLDVTQLQGSLANKADKTDVTNIQLDVNQLKGSMVDVKSDIGNIQLDITQLQGSMATKVTDPNYVHTDNNYDATAKGIVDNIPLDMSQLQGSIMTLKLDVNTLSGSLLYKADKTDLDEWIGPEQVDSTGHVEFDDLDDAYAYKLFGENRIVRIDGQPTKNPGTTAGTVKLTFKTDAPQNTNCVLRMLKPAVPT